MSNINMDWQQDGFTVYALNKHGVNDFSFHVQSNGRIGYNHKMLQKVVSMAEAAPDIYRALREAVWWLEEIMECEQEMHMLEHWKAALAKADGEQQ